MKNSASYVILLLNKTLDRLLIAVRAHKNMTAIHLLLHYVLDIFIFSIQFPILLFRYRYLLRLNFWRWRMTYHSIWLIGNLHAENGDSLNYEHAEKWVYMYVLFCMRGERWKHQLTKMYSCLGSHILNW